MDQAINHKHRKQGGGSVAAYLCAFMLFGGAVLTVPPSVEDPRSLYERAAKLIAICDMASAIEPLESLVQHHSGSMLAGVAVVHLAECYLIEGQAQEAYDLLDTHDIRTEAEVAKRLLSVDLIEQVGQLKTRAARENALTAEDAGDIASALTWLTLATESATDHDLKALEREQLRLRIAICLDAIQVGKRCDPLLVELQDEQQAVVRFALAESLVASNDLKNAGVQLNWLIEYSRTRDKPPDWVATVALRQCETLVAHKNFQSAIVLLENARAKNPDSLFTHQFDFLLARCAIARVEFEAAESHLRNIILSNRMQDDQSRARAHWMLGEVFFLRKQRLKAIDQYSEALSLDAPEWQSRALLQTAKCQQLLGDSVAAQRTYEDLYARFGNTESGRKASQRVASGPSHSHPR